MGRRSDGPLLHHRRCYGLRTGQIPWQQLNQGDGRSMSRLCASRAITASLRQPVAKPPEQLQSEDGQAQAACAIMRHLFSCHEFQGHHRGRGGGCTKLDGNGKATGEGCSEHAAGCMCGMAGWKAGLEGGVEAERCIRTSLSLIKATG
ncbi:hypothetical protein HaLaN_31159 [Haematococcus lacustris]|uniref:Uncharacterized protein n=1 Tax=Haematococcus lacustris TaxID=44745 RepID=A0A6A0AIA3_HAELA|nr:hypothetical protein HaLaN_31159 [Haematococcus lacustris]